MSLHVQPKSRFPVARAFPHSMVCRALCAALAMAAPAFAETPPRLAVTWHGPHTERLDPAISRLQASLARRGLAQAATGLGLDMTIRPSRGETMAGYAIVIEDATGGTHVRITSDGEAAAVDALAFLGLMARLDGFSDQHLHAVPRKSPRMLAVDLAAGADGLSMREIEVQIDAARLLGLDAVRLNLVGARGFAVESQRYPWLAGSAPRLRQAQIRGLVEYAHLRGIVLIPRIDLAALPPETLARGPGFGHGPFDVSRGAARQCLFVLAGEMARLFGASSLEVGRHLPQAALVALNDRLTRIGTVARSDTPSAGLIAMAHPGQPGARDVARADALWEGRVSGTPAVRAGEIAKVLEAGPLE